jgi:hypothetical protein
MAVEPGQRKRPVDSTRFALLTGALLFTQVRGCIRVSASFMPINREESY